MTTKEYMPEVGEECFAKIDGISEEFIVIFVTMYKDDALVVIPSADGRPARYKLDWLRPIKTKAEIEREQAIEDMRKSFRHQSDVPTPKNKVLGILYDDGYRKLKENEVIAKPLSDEQRGCVKSELNSYAATAEYTIDVIQRELGVIS